MNAITLNHDSYRFFYSCCCIMPGHGRFWIMKTTTTTTTTTTNITTTTTTSFLWPSHTYIHKYVDALPASISNVIWKPIHCAPLALLLAEILHSLKLQMINEYWVEKCWSSHGLFFKILIDNHEENEENHFDSWSSDQNWKWMPSRHK